MTVFNGFFIAVFVLFAALQWNDPDPYLWIPIYLFAAFCSYLGLRRRFVPAAFYGGLTVFGGYALFLFFDERGVLYWIRETGAENIAQSMKAEKMWIEKSREFFGLLIACGVLAVDVVFLSRARRRPQPPSMHDRGA